ncbi:DUF349 domain-containing protein [Phocaeicola barnesiae]|jgi:hypothetical protein|uniref:DUF349 domain-containing protein n=1 Tax=Phocaeicola barnesiae TaxID=376804 RepID=A0AAW5N1P6_9BACT|nr:DUF349 domain-containing protein [Phocaeicola barnesiae]MBS6469284.1 DUF349 domain-containing protein [Bacteroides sp.]MCF2576662.1 DUF349 domain-containing protein [Phocaeicola barnesiae]MCF2597608.1 DUF349 domain-containing protein [Phocaeicola barnesiae]MCR8874272.1 DUF349 domain-containing protein [Phocaeicola barnesiae]MDM8233158.1 DUF349 domain-containing protein [Phocaeicola barnesiae]
MELNDTNRPLTETPVENTPSVSVPPIEETENVTLPSKLTKEEVIQRLKEIDEDACNADKQEIDALKQNFYKLHKAEQEAARKAFIEGGGKAEEFTPTPDPQEAEFKQVMGSIKEKRNTLTAAQEQEKEENLAKKLAILDKMKEFTETPEDTGKRYNEFKQLQQEWNEIKQVPAAKVNELWKSYQLYTEKFYDMLKLNNEFREYDFKKNLEAKLHLCEAAEKLATEPDVVSAFHQLQKLHQEFRSIGPVAKELRENIWARFKAASTTVNRRHQQHFEELKEKEQNNLDQKTVICEIVESMEYDTFKTFADWEDKTQEILALQAKWKTIGYAPQKMNVKIFERFRAACDEFFRRKAAFFKSIKESMAENLEKKKALCEKAESLKDSTDWKETAEILTKLQKEWKTIGPVAKKHSDAVWKRFIGACDYFFEQKNKATSSQRSIESENQAKKEAVISQLKALDEAGTTDEATADKTRALMKEWNSIGFVPFKEKDRLYKEYHAVVDRLFDKLHLSATEKKLSNFKSGLNKEGNLYRDREKLVRTYEGLKNDIQTYENNLGFLNSSSKKGNSLVSEINRKIERLKADMELVQKKIAAIDEALSKE